MENKDFDKLFSHKFGQIPGEPYREENWSELSGRIDAFERGRKRRIIPVFWPLLGLLLTSNAFWWHQWHQTTQQLQGAGKQETVVKYDTLMRTTVIYDTVYQHLTVIGQRTETYALRQIPGMPEKNEGRTHPFENNYHPVKEPEQTLTGEPLSSAGISEKTESTPMGKGVPTPAKAAEAGHTISYSVPLQDTFAQTEVLKQPESDSVFEQLLHTPPEIKKVKTPLLTLGRPRLNIGAGWSNPMLTHKRSGALFGLGLGADMEITKHFRLGADLHYWQGKLKADETDELKAVEIPNPGAEYKLRYWETYKLPVVSYDLSLKYSFPTKRLWTWWAGLGAQWATSLPFDIEFDYENPYDHYEVFLPGQTRAITHFQGLMGMLGVEKELNRHFSFGAEGFFLQHPGSNSGILGRQIGLKTRLFYHF